VPIVTGFIVAIALYFSFFAQTAEARSEWGKPVLKIQNGIEQDPIK